MKSTIQLMCVGIVSVTLLSCGSKQSTTASSATTNVTTASSQTSATATTSSNSETTRFTVSFYSKGEGIDGKTNDEFVKFLDSYTKKIAYTPTRWGREGEINYCLYLKELSASEQTEFIKQANVILNKSKLVHVNENAICENKGRVITEPASSDKVAGDNTYRLVVSFYSKGEGPDQKNKQEFEKFLSNQPKKIAFEPTTWGREGEVDYCLKLNELSGTEQTDFVRKAKELLSKSQLVHVNENAQCVNKH